MVGTLNLISVYFAVLFVGLGVDFGIQFSVRYRAERHEVDGLHEALVHAGRRAGAPLTLAALATAAGFLSFLPTAYKGLSELGLIAGFGMLIAFLTSITLLPALFSQVQATQRAASARLYFPRSGRRLSGAPSHADPYRYRDRHPRCEPAAFLAAVRFQPDELAQSQRRSRWLPTLNWRRNRAGGSNDIEALEPTLAQADAVAARLRALPEVSRVTTLSTFIPDHQQEKLPLIQNAARALNKSLYSAKMDPPPTDADNVTTINSTVEIPQQACRGSRQPARAWMQRNVCLPT